MYNSDIENMSPSAPLQADFKYERQHLLPPAAAPPPPTYEYATTTTGAFHQTPFQPTTTNAPHLVVVTQPNERTVAYGPEPVDMQCPICNNFTRTHLRYKASTRTHAVAFVLCCFQLYCCVCIPYCCGCCMNTEHYCGMCNNYLGTYVR